MCFYWTISTWAHISPPCCVLTCSRSEGGPCSHGGERQHAEAVRDVRYQAGDSGQAAVLGVVFLPCAEREVPCRTCSTLDILGSVRWAPLEVPTAPAWSWRSASGPERGAEETRGPCSLVRVSTVPLGGPRPMLLTAMTRNSYSEYGLKPPML